MGIQYFIRRAGNLTGPFSGAELKTLAKSGALTPRDEISRDRRSWTVAGEVRGLEFRALPPPFPPPVVSISVQAGQSRIKNLIAGASAVIVLGLAAGYWLSSPSPRVSPKSSPPPKPLSVISEPATQIEPLVPAFSEQTATRPQIDPNSLPTASANILSQFCEQNKVLARRVLNQSAVVAHGTIGSIEVDSDGTFIVGFQTETFRTVDCELPACESVAVEALKVGGDASIAGTIEIEHHIRLVDCKVAPDDGPVRYEGFPELRQFEKTLLEEAITKHLEAIEDIRKMRGTTASQRRAAIQERELRIKACRAMVGIIEKAQRPPEPEN